MGVRSIVISPSVCLCVCLSVCACLYIRDHISWTAEPIFTTFCVQIPCDCGSVLLLRRCDTLCTPGFMDDITFGRNGRDAETWRPHCHREATTTSSVAIPGRGLMSMNRDGAWCLWMPCFILAQGRKILAQFLCKSFILFYFILLQMGEPLKHSNFLA